MGRHKGPFQEAPFNVIGLLKKANPTAAPATAPQTEFLSIGDYIMLCVILVNPKKVSDTFSIRPRHGDGIVDDNGWDDGEAAGDGASSGCAPKVISLGTELGSTIGG